MRLIFLIIFITLSTSIAFANKASVGKGANCNIIIQGVEKGQVSIKFYEEMCGALSKDPRKRLAKSGIQWNIDGLAKSIDRSDSQAIKLFIEGGMKPEVFLNALGKKSDRGDGSIGSNLDWSTPVGEKLLQVILKSSPNIQFEEYVNEAKAPYQKSRSATLFSIAIRGTNLSFLKKVIASKANPYVWGLDTSTNRVGPSPSINPYYFIALRRDLSSDDKKLWIKALQEGNVYFPKWSKHIKILADIYKQKNSNVSSEDVCKSGGSRECDLIMTVVKLKKEYSKSIIITDYNGFDREKRRHLLTGFALGRKFPGSGLLEIWVDEGFTDKGYSWISNSLFILNNVNRFSGRPQKWLDIQGQKYFSSLSVTGSIEISKKGTYFVSHVNRNKKKFFDPE